MSRGKHPVGRVVKAINFPSHHVVTAIELMMDCEHKGKVYAEGHYAVMDGEDISHIVPADLFRRTYFPICTWAEYEMGFEDDEGFDDGDY